MSTSRGSPLLRQRWPDGSDGHCESLLSRPAFFFRGPFSPLVTHTVSRPPHLRDPRLSQRTSLLSCALPLPHRSPPYPPRFPRCARLFQPRCARLIHRRLGVRFPSGNAARLFHLPVSKLSNIHLFRINIHLFPLKLPHEAHPEIKRKFPEEKWKLVARTLPLPDGAGRAWDIYAVFIHILLCGSICHFMQSIVLFLCCFTHCFAPSIAALYFDRIILFVWFVRIIFVGRVPRFTCVAFRFFFLFATKIYPDFSPSPFSALSALAGISSTFRGRSSAPRDAGGGSQRAGTADTPPVHQP